MNNERIKIISSLVENDFNLERFKEFTARILNVNVKSYNYTGIWKEYLYYIDKVQILSSFEDKDRNKIFVMVVKIKDSGVNKGAVNPIRARTKQRNFISKFLEDKGKGDCAIVAFYNDNYPVWRLSFVKLEFKFSNKEITKMVTPSKRLSFVVGKNESSYTIIKQFSILGNLQKNVSLEELEEVFKLEKVTDDFFDEYKDSYKKVKLHLESDTQFVLEANKHTKKVSEFSEVFAKKLMGQLAFLYFLQKKGWLGVSVTQKEIDSKSSNIDENKVFKFSDKKKNWGEGEIKFIRTLFRRHLEINENTNSKNNFFDNYLEHLFYDALNKDRGEFHYFKKFNCKIPFLNGGLFEPYDNYNWENTNFNIPDSMFSNEDDNGILDIFDRYNFTINENEPLETEIAVDPEMLGKVFESLLNIDERKSKGAFYTPREIVHYMCKESLINFLADKFPKIKKEGFEQLIQMGEFTKEYDLHLFEMEYKKDKKINEDDWGIPIDILRNFKEIDSSISEIKVADPATGSGAFPLGMLNEIIKVRNILTEYFIMSAYFKLKSETKKAHFQLKEESNQIEKEIRENRSLYNLKLQTLQKSLFGVDIEPSAIEITKLRFWLSIIIDSNNEVINQLPNLDFNFMVGNSLINTFNKIKLFDESLLQNMIPQSNEELEQIKLFEKEKNYEQQELFDLIEDKIDYASKLYKLHQLYFNENDSDEKRGIKKDIEDTEWEMIENTLQRSGDSDKIKELRELQKEKKKPYFLWKLEFADVFKNTPRNEISHPSDRGELKGGFDIVIGNPPYIQIQKFSGKQIQKDYEAQKFESFAKTGDIYGLFYEKGNMLLNENGILSFITSNKWMRANYGKKLRKYFSEKTQPLKLIDFGGYKVFESATVDTNILMFRKKEHPNVRSSSDCSEIINQHSEELSHIPKLTACTIREDFSRETDIAEYVEKNSIKLTNLSEESWIISTKEEYAIKQRIEEIGTPLKDWDVNINYGIKTGFITAFIISGTKKDELIEADPKSAEIIKPILRGRDVKRYKAEFADLWLIATFPALHLDIEDYQAVKEYLQTFGQKLEQTGDSYIDKNGNKIKCRKRTNNKWFEVQDTIAYFDEFKKEKIVYPDIAEKLTFVLDSSNLFMNNTCYFMNTTNSNKFVLSVLNSNLMNWYFRNISAQLGKKGLRHFSIYVEKIPIPKISKENQKPFEILVDFILFCKENNFESQSDLFESVIDIMVYGLFFEEQMKKYKCYIFDRVKELVDPFDDDDSFDDKVEYLELLSKVFNEDKIVKRGLIYSRTVPEVKIINGVKYEK